MLTHKSFIVIDTGGLSGEEEGIDALMAEQVWQAVVEADLILFIVDARSGLIAPDEVLAQKLRRLHKKVHLVVNKIDGVDVDTVVADFYSIGFGEPYPIAASHGRGVTSLISKVSSDFPEQSDELAEEQPEGVKIAFIGRPNVGKSTLINRILGEDRVVVCDQPGTTRDSIFVPFTRQSKDYVLIDTAGIRRRGRVSETVEKFSIVKALQAINTTNVVVLVLDAHDGITEQDLRLLGFVIDAGRALVIAINKWDGMEQYDRERVKKELDRRLAFVDFAELHFISALHGTGVGNIFSAINKAYASAMKKLSTPKVTRILRDAVAAHEPPLVHGRRLKLRYAHVGGHNPPIIVIHGTQTKSMKESYRKYLEKTFRKALNLAGTPLKIELVSGKNPYEGKKNKLTDRQTKKRKRLIKHVKRK